jgi:hypothetical protein
MIVLDVINTTVRSHFECLGKLIVSRLNGTDLHPEFHNDTNMTELPDKMNKFREEYRNSKAAAMALILSDNQNTSEKFDELDPNKEPYMVFINVGQNLSEADSCYRRYKYIQTELDLPELGRQLEQTACNRRYIYITSELVIKSGSFV